MSDIAREQIEELRRLDEAATPGPWPAVCRPVASGSMDLTRMKAVEAQGHFIKIGLHDHVVAHTDEDIADVTRERIDGDYVRYHYHNERDPKRELHPDAELISRVRDALPALLNAADERDELRDRLRRLAWEWSQERGEHPKDVLGYEGGVHDCAQSLLNLLNDTADQTERGEQIK